MRKHQYYPSHIKQDVMSTTIDLNDNLKIVLNKVQLKRGRRFFNYEVIRTNSTFDKEIGDNESMNKIFSGNLANNASFIKATLSNLPSYYSNTSSTSKQYQSDSLSCSFL